MSTDVDNTDPGTPPVELACPEPRRTVETNPPATAGQPHLAISGNATDEEIAAVTAVVTALARPVGDGQSAPSTNDWAAHWRRIGTAPAPGPDTWRMSARP